MQHLENPYGDCQLFLDQELPNKFFTFFNTPYMILNSSEEKVKKSPFSALLVGPAYACTHIMKSFEEWATLHKDSLSIYKKPIKNSTQNKTPKKIKQNIKFWQPIYHPTVWAQATFSVVSVTSFYPQVLQEEIQKFFDFPIIVKALDPISYGRHNELAAWLTAFYALIVARNLCRPVLCHSMTWISHLQFFTNSGIHDLQPYFPFVPPLWQPLIKQKISTFSNTPQHNSNTYNTVKKLTQFETRHKTYQHKTIKISRIIGIGYASKPIITQETSPLLTECKECKIKLEILKNRAYITLPVNASTSTKLGLKNIVANLFELDIQAVYIQYQNTKILSTLYNYSILANMILRACNAIKSKKNSVAKTISLLQCKTLKKYLCSASVVTEFDVTLNTQTLQLSKANIVLDIGYIANKKIVIGMIENMFYRSFISLCSNNAINYDTFNLDIQLLNESNQTYTSSVAQLVQRATLDAITNTIAQNSKSKSFPTQELLL